MSSKETKQAFDALVKETDGLFHKEIGKLLNRIEHIFVPSYSYGNNDLANKLKAIRQKLEMGVYYTSIKEFTPENIVKALSKNSSYIVRKMDWDLFESEVRAALGEHPDDAFYLREVEGEIAREKSSHIDRTNKCLAKEKIRQMQVRNNQAVVTGKWRKEPYGQREYVPLKEYVVTDSVTKGEAEVVLNQLNTPLNGYLGQAYNYDDQGLTEEWMKSFRNGGTTASGNDVIRTQLVGLMEIMISQVQDRVYNEQKILEKEPIVLGKDVVEVPVWGIDSYTRRMIEIVIEDSVPVKERSNLTIKNFIEQTLLPTINRQLPEKAHDLSNALKAVLDDANSSPRDRIYASAIHNAFVAYGFELFKVHPKGTGVICIRPEGIPAHVLVAEYLGELYPAYRWCERLDVIEQAQKRFELKPTLPDFYNILLERPRQDPNGYGLLYVDASQKANIGSSCSHSCAANCTSAIVARNGKLTIAMTTNRFVNYGEELTFDYYSITTSDVEWRAAVCLCGMTTCRGSFLSYATQDDLQQVLNQNFGPVSRFASLLRACSDRKVTAEDTNTLAHHGIKQAILGTNPPNWMIKYAADILRFVEFERKALPCALLRPSSSGSSEYCFSGADMDARCVMEQRIQSMVCCFSMINRVLEGQKDEDQTPSVHEKKPLSPVLSKGVIRVVWEILSKIPALLEQYLLKFNDKSPEVKALRTKKVEVTQLIDAVRACLATEPSTMAAVRETCLSIRKLLLVNESLSFSKARLVQLADILVFWACTVNFSFPQAFQPVSADPILVPARELGSMVPRSILTKVTKADAQGVKKALRRNNVGSGIIEKSPVATTVDEAVESAEGDMMEVVVVSGSASVSAEDLNTSINTTQEVESFSMDVDDTSISKEGLETEAAVVVVVSPSASSVHDDHGPEPSVQDNEDTSEKATGESPVKPKKSAPTSKKDLFLNPNEPVFTGSKVYDKLFCFWQLIGWFNAGSDQKVDAPDLFGCVELPDPSSCFGSSSAPYTSKQRDTLISILRNEKLMAMNWPASLQATFNLEHQQALEVHVYGSPMLDAALGQIDSVAKVLREILSTDYSSLSNPEGGGAGNSRKAKAQNKKDITSRLNRKGASGSAAQLDDVLAPEAPTSWVQCDACSKWRRVPWHVEADSLPDPWHCDMNTWDCDVANCDVPQDSFDPSREDTLVCQDGEAEEKQLTLADFQINTWWDLYCNTNQVYYEAQVRRVRQPTGKKKGGPAQLHFHYRGWSSQFDEWVDFDSDRIRPHNLFTNPMTTDPREQEIWQGMMPVQSVLRTAFKQTTGNGGNKKRKSAGGSEAAAGSPSKKNKTSE